MLSSHLEGFTPLRASAVGFLFWGAIRTERVQTSENFLLFDCMTGSWQFSEYVGGGYRVDWGAQRQSEFNSVMQAFQEQEAAVPGQLGVTVEMLRSLYLNADGSLKDPGNPNNPYLQGGNWNFATNMPVPADCGGGRCGSIPSLHYHDGFVHLDTANPFWGYGLGLAVHAFWDVGLGNTFLAGGIPR